MALSRVKALLPKNRFARSVGVLAGGTAAGQAVVVLASPVLTRLYSPEDFGLLAVYAGLLGIFAVVASLRYQLAIPLPESDEEAAGIAVLSLVVVLGMTLLTTLLVIFFGPPITALLNIPELASYLWLLPVGLLLTGVYQVFNYWAIRRNAFPVIARTKLTQAAGMVSVQIGGYALGPIALLLGRILGQSAGIATLAHATSRGSVFHSFVSRRPRHLRSVAAAYRNFPLLSTWTGLANSAGTNLPPVLIAALLGAGPAGIFALTHRVLSQPMAVLGKAVNDVFYRQATDAYKAGNLGKLVPDIYSKLVAAALPVAVFIFLVSPAAFVFVFGHEWKEAGEVARWVTPWLFLQFVVSPCTGIYPIIDRHDIALRFQTGLLLSGLTSALVGSIVFDSLLAIVIFMSISNGVIYLWRVMTTYSVVGVNTIYPVTEILKAVPVSLLCNLPLILHLLMDQIPFNDAFSVLAFGIPSLILIVGRIFSVVRYQDNQVM